MSDPEGEIEVLPLLDKPRRPSRWVADPDSLELAYRDLKQNGGAFAIDAERASGFKYSQRAYLIQIRSSNSDIYLIDPIAFVQENRSKEFGNFSALLKDREWILHAATQDLPCLAELELTPGALFDTELAARILGFPKVGLGSMAESLLGFRLAKEHSAADWSTRPLPESWLNYAALDVDVLHELKDAVSSQLLSEGKADWAKQEFQALLGFTPKPAREEKWRAISGLHKITDRKVLSYAKALWEAREELAKKLDVSPGRLLPDSSILAISTNPVKSKPELASRRDFTGRASRSYLDHWWQAISAAMKSTELPTVRGIKAEGIPNHRNWATKFPEADARLRVAKSALQEISERNNLPLENLLAPDNLRQLSFTPPVELTSKAIASELKKLGARDWQIELTAEAISVAFIRSAESTGEAESPPEAVEHAEPSNQQPEQQSL